MEKRVRIAAARVVATSFAVNCLDVSSNGLAAILTGSMVMNAELLQGFADLVAVGLLIIGLHQARRPADRGHQFGYGKESYVWTLFAALIMFVLTAGFSFYFGLQRVLSPQDISLPWVAVTILTVGLVSNSYAFSLSWRRLVGRKNWRRIVNIFFRSTLAETKTAFVLDLAGTVAAALGLLSLLAYFLIGDARLDGFGAMLIGVSLAVFAGILIAGIKDLLVGRSASPELAKKIVAAALVTPEVEEVLDLRTMLLGPDQLLVNIEVHMNGHLTVNQAERLLDHIKNNIQHAVPEVRHIQVELETPSQSR